MKQAVLIFMAVGCFMLLIPLMAFGTGEEMKVSGLSEPRDSGESSIEEIHKEATVPVREKVAKEILRALEKRMEASGEEISAERPVGKMKLYDAAVGEVIELEWEEYIKRALFAEADGLCEPEYLKALGIAINSCAVSGYLSGGDEEIGGAYAEADSAFCEGFITEDAAREKFGEDLDAVVERVSDAAHYAKDRVIIYEGEVAAAPFHKASPGKTESAYNVWGIEVPYLIPVVSAGEDLSENCFSVCEISAEEFRALISAEHPDAAFPENTDGWITEMRRSESGYVLSITVGGVGMSGAELRTQLGLRSAAFEVGFEDGKAVFTVRGEGHGVGMSETGAEFAAEAGATAEEILARYYPGTETVIFRD